MALITIYSQCMNDIELRTYEHVKDSNGKVLDSKITGKQIIAGRNSSYRKGRILLESVTTMVDKDWWEKFMATEGIGNQLIETGQIYAAKNESEAAAIGKDAKTSIFDPLSQKEIKNRADRKDSLVNPLV